MRHGEKGFTLIEVVLATSIAVVIVAAAGITTIQMGMTGEYLTFTIDNPDKRLLKVFGTATHRVKCGPLWRMLNPLLYDITSHTMHPPQG